MTAPAVSQDPNLKQDREAMVRLAAGDDSSMDELIDRHGNAIYNFLIRMVGDATEARDLAQETFVRVFRSRHTFRSDGDLRPWVFSIAGNLARNHLRWRSRRRETPLEPVQPHPDGPRPESIPGPEHPPSEILVAAEIGTSVRRAVDGLSAEMREAVLLVDLHGLSIRETATIAGASPRTIESRLYHARRILRRRLEQLGLGGSASASPSVDHPDLRAD